MFLGHYGLGFMAKKAARGPSLGTLFLAAQFIDLLWPVLLILGIEQVEIMPGDTRVTPLHFSYYPYSHSLIMVLLYGMIFASVYYLIKKNLKGALILAVLVLSHWILDLITHRPDLPLWPGAGSPHAGIGLWNFFIGTVIVELGIFGFGIFYYLRSTKVSGKAGSYLLWAQVIFLLIIYGAAIFSPPPPETKAVAISGLFQWLIVAWGYWIDKFRVIAHDRGEEAKR
jgi:hypothetical protein